MDLRIKPYAVLLIALFTVSSFAMPADASDNEWVTVEAAEFIPYPSAFGADSKCRDRAKKAWKRCRKRDRRNNDSCDRQLEMERRRCDRQGRRHH